MRKAPRTAFRKGDKRPRGAGRAKGQKNYITLEVKEVLSLLLPRDELERRWRKLLNSKNEWIALRAFELALLYRYGKPKSNDEGEAGDIPLVIDISAIPRPKLPESNGGS